MIERVQLGRTGFKVSPVGFGGYRITDRDRTHHEALKLALLSGCNLVDTSTNYANGGSERLVGKVLRELTASNQLKRSDIVVVTKAGYVQGENLDLVMAREEEGKPFPDVVKYDDGCWHCISPEFLEDQLTRSLERLQLDKVDVLLLHNPEYFLMTENDHAEYYERIRRAFEHLEKEVARGRISWYGISSNTFPEPKENPDYTSLETVLEIADSIRKDHHFAVIQFPFNLFEPGAALEHNNTGRTIAQLAKERGLGTLVNRPLNAIIENRLIRLADFPASMGKAYEVHAEVSERIKTALDHFSPELASSPTLSQKVIRLYRSVQGIHCILVGMRQPAYVKDTLALQPPLKSEDDALAALRAAQELQ